MRYTKTDRQRIIVILGLARSMRQALTPMLRDNRFRMLLASDWPPDDERPVSGLDDIDEMLGELIDRAEVFEEGE